MVQGKKCRMLFSLLWALSNAHNQSCFYSPFSYSILCSGKCMTSITFRFVNETVDDQIVTCECDHLTNFAVLMDIQPSQHYHQRSLNIITWIGCVLSLLGLFITILVFASFTNLRQKLHTKILLSLCTSLAVLLSVFVTGIDRCQYHTLCQIVAVVLHYFLLTSFAWMAVTALTMFQFLVLLFRRVNEQKYFVRLSLVAWGCPALIVFVTTIIEHHLGSSNNKKFCFPQGTAAHLGVLLPICIVLIGNVSVLVAVMVKFTCRRMRSSSVKVQQGKVNEGRLYVTMSVLLGVTWMLGVIAVGEVEVVFEHLFCILNSLQGFFIFVLHVVMNAEVRKELKSFICRKINFDFLLWKSADSSSTTSDVNNNKIDRSSRLQAQHGSKDVRKSRTRSNEELVLVLLQQKSRTTPL